MNGPVDLNSDPLDTVRAILAEHLPGVEVRGFCSRPTWAAKCYSDLDLVVAGCGKLDRRALSLRKEVGEESQSSLWTDLLR